MSTNWRARTATPADRERCLDTLAAAFHGDPVIRYLVDHRDLRRTRLFFDAVLAPAWFAQGRVDLVDDGIGVAVWEPPGGHGLRSHPSPAQYLRFARAFRGRSLRANRFSEALLKAQPTTPHHYLLFLGVQPSLTGRGIGSALLRHRLTQIDALGQPAGLESSKSRNIPLYERFGFEITGQWRGLPDAPPEWPMWRSGVPVHDATGKVDQR